MTKDDLSPTQGIARASAPPPQPPPQPETDEDTAKASRPEKTSLPELNMFKGKGIYLHTVA